MRNYLLCSILAISVSGCVTQPTQPLDIKPEVASVRLSANVPKDRIRHEKGSGTTIRTYKFVSGKNGKMTEAEVAGASCTLQSDHLSANVVTPQKIVLPYYDQNAKLPNRGVPPSILVKCRAGNLNGQSLLAAKPGKISSGGSGNLVVDLIFLAGTAAVAASADWRYAEGVKIVLK